MKPSEVVPHLMRLHPNCDMIIENDDLFQVHAVGDESVDLRKIVWTWEYRDGDIELIDAKVDMRDDFS